MRTLIYILLLCAIFPKCYAKTAKGNAHISSIYINTPDSSVKASVTDQPGKNIQTGRIYHWYASNQLCVTNGAYSGRLLHGTYSSFYPNHFLLAQGQFRSGLKDGCWKRWLPDGSLHEIIHYKNGQLHGTHEIYSPKGYLMERIYYRKGARAGKTTIFSQDGKDSVIIYKKGVPEEQTDNRRKTEEKKRAKKGNDSLNGKKTGEKKHSEKGGDSLNRKNKSTNEKQKEDQKKRAKKDSTTVERRNDKIENSDTTKTRKLFPLWKRKAARHKHDPAEQGENASSLHSRLSSHDSRLR